MMSASILVVDDDPVVQDTVRWLLRSQGYDVDIARNGEEALSRIAQQEFDVVVSAIKMPGLNGLEVLERSRALKPNLKVILMTGDASLETAIEALRLGAADYLRTPFELDDLTLSVDRALRSHRSVGTAPPRQLATATSPSRPFAPPAPSAGRHLVGESPAIVAVRERIARCALTPSNVLITGESGVGKELVASAIHAAGPRCERPFIAVNCGAIPATLIESQLFGHVRGAFTGALRANPGLVVAANHGTLFLDEIGELPLAAPAQAAAGHREPRGVAGGGDPARVARRPHHRQHQPRPPAGGCEGRFREDLFYRLDVVHIALPPLRERRGDIPLLVDHLVRRLNRKLGTGFMSVEPDALRALAAQPWKGNVRELENALERAMVLGSGQQVRLQHLALEPTVTPRACPAGACATRSGSSSYSTCGTCCRGPATTSGRRRASSRSAWPRSTASSTSTGTSPRPRSAWPRSIATSTSTASPRADPARPTASDGAVGGEGGDVGVAVAQLGQDRRGDAGRGGATARSSSVRRRA